MLFSQKQVTHFILSCFYVTNVNLSFEIKINKTRQKRYRPKQGGGRGFGGGGNGRMGGKKRRHWFDLVLTTADEN